MTDKLTGKSPPENNPPPARLMHLFAYRSLIPGIILIPTLAALSIHAAEFKFSNQTLTVPNGFLVERVAGPPLVERPVYGSFDEQGRLYLVDSSGSNDKPDKQLQDKPHRVVRLEAAGADGHFTKGGVFADKMMFPEGCLWYDGSVYVAAPPSIWKLTDTDGDGVADKREEWFQGKTLTGCANDLHGPYLGPDGWIYWCKGAFAKQSYDRPGKPPFVTRAAHIFRSRPDGSGIEPVLTGGMDNPVSVAFTPEGERILCGTFFDPDQPGHRDGLIHAIYGGVYGKINDVTDDHKKTGDLMPVMTHMGPAAPCSVIRYESAIFGHEYQDNLFVCQFNMHKVTRHVLEPDGTTFKTRDIDFVTSDSTDFHPTDVIEDADGSLLVIDTGGWYKLCCPTSQLPKPDVLGAIYRIRRNGASRLEDPRGLKLTWKGTSAEELAKRLADERPAVCKRAQQELERLGNRAVGPLAKVLQHSKVASVRRNALWVLTRIDAPSARAAVRSGLKDEDESVKLTALHSVSLWRDAETISDLAAFIRTPNSPVQRIAAEALGRIGADFHDATRDGRTVSKNSTAAIVQALAAGLEKRHDRVLEHSLVYALIETDDPKATSTLSHSANPCQKRGALIALDQMDNGNLQADEVAPLLASTEPMLREAASWVAAHHRDWGGALAGFFRQRLAAPLDEADAAELEHLLGQFAQATEIQTLVAASLKSDDLDASKRKLLLAAMAKSNLKQCPADWSDAVRFCLDEKKPELLHSAVATAKALSQSRTNSSDFSLALLRIAHDTAQTDDLRLEALEALPAGLSSVEPGLFSFLCATVDPSKPVLMRSAAATVLARSRLKEDQLLALAGTAGSTGPLELSKLLEAFERSTNEDVGLKLMGALKQAKALNSVRPDQIQVLVAKYPQPVQERAKDVLTLLNVDPAKQAAHLEELLASLKDGDIRRGQAIFNSQKAACFSCHRMGYMGGNVGPDLTSIGQVRTPRDLLESVVYPSASFVRSYEPLIVTTKSDEQYSGVVRKDAADEVVLATGPNAEVRIARSDIVEVRPGTVSVMPAGLEEQLSKQELADLLAFLKATKWGPR